MGERNITITMKADKGHDAPWISFAEDSADAAKKHIIDTFGLKGQEDATLHQVTLLGNAAWQGGNAVQTNLGGTPIGDEDAMPKAEDKPKPTARRRKATASKEEATEGKAEKVEEEPAPKEEDPKLTEVKELIAKASTKDELTEIWRTHRPVYRAVPALKEIHEARKSELA